MNEALVEIPKNSVAELIQLLFPENTFGDSKLVIKIRIHSENLTLRELGNYFLLIDRFYGRLYFDGFNAYTHRDYEHLKISKVNNGSIEAIIEEASSIIFSKHGEIVILALLLKYLPHIIVSSSEAIRNLADSYKIYQEASQIREDRKNRRSLKEALRKDEQLKRLTPYHLEQIVRLLDLLYSKEIKVLSRAIKFARKKVKSVIIEIKKNN